MSNYDLVKTSVEVIAAIIATHPNMVPFGSFSDPEGRWMGGPGEEGRMETDYGFTGLDFPTFRIKTTWKIGPDGDLVRGTKKHEYWLCIGKEML